MVKVLIGSLYLFNLTVFAMAIPRLFVRPGGMPGPMLGLSAAGLIVGVLQTTILFREEPSVVLWRSIVSATCSVLSLGFFCAAERATRCQRLSIAYSKDLPTHLNVSGPYWLVRHPFYTAYFLNWLVPFVFSGAPLAGVGAAFMFLLYYNAARAEERKFARGPLAQQYASYASRTGMFLPKLMSYAIQRST